MNQTDADMVLSIHNAIKKARAIDDETLRGNLVADLEKIQELHRRRMETDHAKKPQ